MLGGTLCAYALLEGPALFPLESDNLPPKGCRVRGLALITGSIIIGWIVGIQ
jgi:hypothetical protein